MCEREFLRKIKNRYLIYLQEEINRLMFDMCKYLALPSAEISMTD